MRCDQGGDRRLAGSAEASDGEKDRSALFEQHGCEIEIGPRLPEETLRCVSSGIVGLCRRDMRPNGGTDRHEEGYERQAVRLVAFIEVAIEDDVREPALVPMPQVHQEKGQVVQDVDRCQGLVEFKAVEQRGLAIDQADVAQDQIAVTAPDLARSPARLQAIRMRGKRLSERVGENPCGFGPDERRSSEGPVIDVEYRSDPG